jgi:myosin heavy subunit
LKFYRGLNFIVNKWKHRDLDKEVTEFQDAWNGAYQARVTNAEIDEKAMIIQKTWRGYQERKRLRKLNEGFSKFQKIYQAKREFKDKRKQKQMARDELKFQLVLEHRRRQRQKKVKLLELLEILPADKIEDYLEKQRQYSATKIQAGFRGYRARKELTKHREEILRERAAVKIQRAVISLIT